MSWLRRPAPAPIAPAREAERPADHARHDARRSHRQLRLRRGGDAESRSSRGGRRPLRAGAVVGAADVAVARQPDDRAAAVHARRAEQRPLHARRMTCRRSRRVRGRGVRHGGVRQLVRARSAVRARARVRALRRALDAPRGGCAVSLELERRGDRTVAAATGWLARARGAASRSSSGSTSTIRTIRTSPPSPFREQFAAAVRRRDRFRRRADRHAARRRRAIPVRRRWSWSPATTARASASTVRARTGLFVYETRAARAAHHGRRRHRRRPW